MNQNIPDELIDIVNEHDQVVKTMWRSQAKDEKYRRIVLAFLKYQDGSICFLRRTPDKDSYPSCLAVVGGCVQAGESYEEAFKREVFEEVKIDVTQHQYRLLGIMHPSQITPGSLFKAVYEITISDLAVPYNPEDFSEYVWCKPQSFLDDVAQKDLICPDLPILVDRFYINQK